VCGAALLYGLVLSAASIRRHDTFLTGGYDLGIFDQAVWLLGRGAEPFSTVRGRNLFADHFQPALALLAPLGALGGGAAALLTVQAFVLAAASPVLYVLARLRNASGSLALAVALMWLASPLTQWANLFDYHPETAVPLLLVLGAVFLERGLLGPFLAAAVLASSFKEDVCLVYLMWGVALAIGGRRRLGSLLALGGAVWFVLATSVVIPAFGGNYDYYSSRFGGERGSSLGNIFVTLVQHPLRTLADTATPSNGGIVVALVACTGGLALLAPRMLLPALPALASNLLSAYSYQHDLHFQYQLVPAAVFAVASAYGAGVLQRRVSRTRRRAAAAILVGGAVLTALAFSPAVDALRRHADHRDDEAKRRALALIPPNASVAAAPNLAPHLTHRRAVYQLPEPFFTRPTNGEYWSDAELARRARRVAYVAYDLEGLDPWPLHQVRQLPRMLLGQGFVEIFRAGDVRVFRRRMPAP